MKDASHTALFEKRDVIIWHDSTNDHKNLGHTPRTKTGHEFGDEQMIAGKRTDTNDLHILLPGDRNHFLDLEPRPRQNHLHSGISQSRGHYAISAVVTV